jgi:hypothetical protein
MDGSAQYTQRNEQKLLGAEEKKKVGGMMIISLLLLLLLPSLANVHLLPIRLRAPSCIKNAICLC